MTRINSKYEIENIFNHAHTGEKLYRIKITYPSGGITLKVLNDYEMSLLVRFNK